MRKTISPFLLGFMAFSSQIYLMREFNAQFHGNEITYGLLLASWLFWGGIGSLSASRIKFKLSRQTGLFCISFILLPVALALIRYSRFVLGTLPAETSGIVPMFLFIFLLCLLIGFPLGILFVFNVHFQSGDLSKVYLVESLGSATAGVLLYFWLIPVLSDWQGVSIIIAFVCLGSLFVYNSNKYRLTSAGIILFLLLFSLIDGPSQKAYWKPFHLIESCDSAYGRIQVIKTADQISLYSNSQMAYSYPNLAGAEESIHFALLQNPEAEDVLLIGGAIGGGLKQLMKYPHVRAQYAELDPTLIRVSRRYLPEQEQALFDQNRIKIIFEDGRTFLNRTQQKYDMIILNLPEPATAQINRFYTLEFFQSARSKLKDGGLLSFKVPSSENYISRERQNFLSSLYFSLKTVFPNIKIVPGTTNIFLASDSPLTLDIKTLTSRISELKLNNTFVSPAMLFDRLNPLKVEQLRQSVQTGNTILNRDYRPISYFFNTILWNSQFKNTGSDLFVTIANLGRFALMDIPLILFILGLLFVSVKRNKEAIFMIPLGVLGMTTIVLELILIFAFQVSYGCLFRSVAILFTGFMAGLSIGAFHGKLRKQISFYNMPVIQSGFVLFILLTSYLLGTSPPDWIFVLLLLGLGYLGGHLFIVSNRLYLQYHKNYGLGYAIDLLGSFSGALLTTAIMIPLFGLMIILKYLVLINSFCLLYLIFCWKKIHT
jgi:spermidine synthase